MNYAEIKPLDVANGPGVRVSLFVSGCTHHCKNCFNKETWDFNYGNPYTLETEEYILKCLEPDYVKGLTLLGGEPFEPENQKILANLVERVKKEYPNKTIWAFSGYLFDHDIIEKMYHFDFTKKLLANIDVLVDGPFIEALKMPGLRFKGSANQRTIDVQKTLKDIKFNNNYFVEKITLVF